MVFKSFFRVLLLKRLQHRITNWIRAEGGIDGHYLSNPNGASFFIFFFHNRPAPDHVYMGTQGSKSCDLLLASICVFGFIIFGKVYFTSDDPETTLMITTIPPIGILIDLPFGFFMWTSVAHFLLTIVIREDSAFIILRVLRNVNSPIHWAINHMKPGFITARLTPLYCALVLFILRYYLLPLLVGFDIWNFYDMPLERLLFSAWADLDF